MGNGTSIGRVRGLGSSHHGTHHFLASRLSAVGNLILLPYLLISLVLLPGYDYTSVHAWLSQPLAATALILTIINTFYHARLGVQVMLEDYVHEAPGKLLAWVFVNFVPFAGAAYGVISVIRIALGGA